MKKTISILTILTIAFYILTFAIFGIKYKADYTQNLRRIDTQFKSLTILISSIYSATNSFASNYFGKRVREVMGANNKLESIIITDSDGKIEYLFTKDKRLIKNIEETSGYRLKSTDTILKIFNLNPLVHTYKTKLLIIPNTTLRLHSIYSVIPYSVLYNKIKDLFYIFLIFFIIVAIFTLYVLTSEEEKSTGNTLREKHQENKTTIYSDYSGIPKGDYLDVKLEEELKKADIDDSNLSLAIVAIDDFNRIKQRDDAYLALGKTLLRMFPAKNLIFEWDSGFAIILPETNIKQAITKMEKLRQTIIEKYYPIYKYSVSIGISSKNNRDISSTRLIKETSLSLQKAVNEGKNQVIAFNADPQKYSELHV